MSVTCSLFAFPWIAGTGLLRLFGREFSPKRSSLHGCTVLNYNLIRHATLRKPAPYTVGQGKSLLRQFKQDVYQGVFEYSDFAIQDVLQEFTAWSAGYGFQHIVTTFDLLHISAAIALGADQFVTTDERQHAAAQLAGLSSALIR